MEYGVNVEKIGSSLNINNWKPKTTGFGIYCDTKQYSLAINKDTCFMLGGTTRGEKGELGTTDIKYFKITAGGVLEGFEDLDITLPRPLFSADTFCTDKYVFFIGGDDGENNSPNIYRAEKLDNGLLDSWKLAAKLPYSVSDHKVIRINDYLYIIGGFNGENTLKTIYRYTLDANDSLLNPTACLDLPIDIGLPLIFFIKNKLYILGGYQGADYDALNSVYSNTLTETGELSNTWVKETDLPIKLFAASMIAYGNRLFILGGNDGKRSRRETYCASIDANGIIGQWENGPDLPKEISTLSPLVTSLGIYLIGGAIDCIYAPFDGWDNKEIKCNVISGLFPVSEN